MSKKIAVFASGNGSNFQVIGEQFPVEFVFSDHRDAYVLERAKNLGIKSYTFELKEFDNKIAYEQAIIDLLEKYAIDLVCLAGYMKIVGPTLRLPIKVALSISIQPICQNFQVLMVSKMPGMPVSLRAE
mgnify:CR=1 FL=1